MLTATIFAPLAGAIALFLISERHSAMIRGVAIAVSLVPLALLIVAWMGFESSGGFELVESAAWIPTLGVRYIVGVDGVSLPLASMTALLFVASIAYPADVKGRPREYYALFLFLECASLGVFLALDLFLFYVFWDVSLVGMFFLIGGWGHGDSARRAGLKFFLYTLAGSLAMLLAILGLYLAMEPHTFDMAAIIEQQPLGATGVLPVLVFMGFALAFVVKAPLVPFHTWLPPAHVEAPAAASAILAGVMLKMGTYGFVRILLQMLPEAFQRFALPMAVLALVSIIYGALVALAQGHMKRRIAYTSVNHMGYAVLGVSAAAGVVTGLERARALALTGAVVEMVAHGLITGALFLISGSVWRRAGTYEIADFGGLAGRARVLTLMTAVAAFASLGLPGLAGFVAEFQIFVGTFSVFPWIAGVGLLGILITAALFLQMLQRVFLGPRPERWNDWPPLARSEVLALSALLFFVVLIGVAPAWLLTVIHATSSSIIGS